MKLPRAKCPYCLKICAVRPPMGGDGSVDVYPRHMPLERRRGDQRTSYCDGSRQEVEPQQYWEV